MIDFDEVYSEISGHFLTEYIPADMDMKEIVHFIDNHKAEVYEYLESNEIDREIRGLTVLFCDMMMRYENGKV